MSEILERWQACESLSGVLVIDGHTHVGEWPFGENSSGPEAAAEGAVAFMDAHGVDAACVLGGGYMFSNGCDYRMGNDFLLACVRRAPEGLIPFAHINACDSRKAVLAALERMVDSGVHALKLYNSYLGYPADGPNMMAIYAFAEAHNLLLLNHYWPEDTLRKIAADFPTVTFIRGHGGASALSHEIPNVYDNIWGL